MTERWQLLADAHGEDLARALLTPAGARAGAALRGVQAAALVDIAAQGGLFLQGRIGCGKFLCAILAPAMLGPAGARPLLCMPGGLVAPSRAALAAFRQHWDIPTGIVLASFQAVSRLPGKGRTLADLPGLGGQLPTCVIADEAHELSNVGVGGSGVANQFNDLFVAHPEIAFVAATGTGDSLRRIGHLLDWALRDRSPAPRDPSELEVWATVLDDGDASEAPYVARALGCAPTVAGCRAAFRARLRSWPGVIVKDDPFTGVPLTLGTWEPPGVGAADEALAPHWTRLRTLHQRPDGLEVVAPEQEDAAGDPDRVEGPIWHVARRMARGLCYVADPRPPESYREARRSYGRHVRVELACGQAYTELQVRERCDAEPQSSGGRALAWWRDEARLFNGGLPPGQATLWLSNAALEAVEQWGREAPGLIFVDDRAFARALAERTGWAYYGDLGRDARGRAIEDEERAPRERTVIAQRGACGTGRNLQYHWCRMLFVTGPAGKSACEQNVGRLMREGQSRPVSAEFLCICPEDFRAVDAILTGVASTGETLYDLTLASARWESPRSAASTPKQKAFWQV